MEISRFRYLLLTFAVGIFSACSDARDTEPQGVQHSDFDLEILTIAPPSPDRRPLLEGRDIDTPSTEAEPVLFAPATKIGLHAWKANGKKETLNQPVLRPETGKISAKCKYDGEGEYTFMLSSPWENGAKTAIKDGKRWLQVSLSSIQHPSHMGIDSSQDVMVSTAKKFQVKTPANGERPLVKIEEKLPLKRIFTFLEISLSKDFIKACGCPEFDEVQSLKISSPRPNEHLAGEVEMEIEDGGMTRKFISSQNEIEAKYSVAEPLNKDFNAWLIVHPTKVSGLKIEVQTRTRHITQEILVPVQFMERSVNHWEMRLENTAQIQTKIEERIARRPIANRLHPESEVATLQHIINGEWISVGLYRTDKEYPIQWDDALLLNGKPSYRFELKGKEDNTLSAYGNNGSKGRAELSFNYATEQDFSSYSSPSQEIDKAVQIKKINQYGKGVIPQGCTSQHSFSVFFSDKMATESKTIFAQIHSMNDRTLIQQPDGEIRQLSDEEFLALLRHTYFDNNIGKDKITKRPNGYLVEQGGYPPISFSISNGYVALTCNSDRRWLSNKDERVSAHPERLQNMEYVESKPDASGQSYKRATMAWKMPFKDFPRNRWVRFDMEVKWTLYGKQSNQIVRPGQLFLKMTYQDAGRTITETLVDRKEILVGSNDEPGYYFKMGIYRTNNQEEVDANRVVPIAYHMGGYAQKILQR